MNRKNLTAAVLAGLAGAAGIAGTAQAVNLNPDGLGQVLIYPYYTTNDGNDTLLSVVNTSSDAKAVKVRFKEGYNSREVLDFNMYMSAYDVWVAAIIDIDGTPNLIIPDTTCTVPYLYEDNYDEDYEAGVQPFLPYDYDNDGAGHEPYRLDGGPTDISRAAEGYFEMIEMGTLTNDSEEFEKGKLVRLGSADAATHVIDDDGFQHPEDCGQLVDNWTNNAPKNHIGAEDGMWLDDETNDEPWGIDIARNSGGLFGGAAIINVGHGTMFSYDAKAIQGFDKTSDGHLHAEPGNSHPNLNDGSENDATVFFGTPLDKSVTLHYDRTVDAISAVFMHENTMNEFNIEPGLHAGSEWVLTFPTKNWYVDNYTWPPNGTHWEPDPADEGGCNFWEPGDDYPPWNGPGNSKASGWETCDYREVDDKQVPVPPFTSEFDGEACEPFGITIWDREESASEGNKDSSGPIVSPPPPPGEGEEVDGEICYEVNVLRFGNDGEYTSVFGTDSDLLLKVDTGFVVYNDGKDSKPIYNGWGTINWAGEFAVLCETGLCQDDAQDEPPYGDWYGLLGLPVTGFWAEQFTNGYLGEPGDRVLANYGGLFQHKGNIRRTELVRD